MARGWYLPGLLPTRALGARGAKSALPHRNIRPSPTSPERLCMHLQYASPRCSLPPSAPLADKLCRDAFVSLQLADGGGYEDNWLNIANCSSCVISESRSQ